MHTRVHALWLAGGLSVIAGCGGGEIGVDAGDPDAGIDASAAIDGGETTSCGDGVTQRTEVCDDRNTVSGDGCSADCQSDESCGNAYVDTEAGELCDDGNTDDGDRCRGDCHSDYACGNRVTDTVAEGAPADEVCDDGNTLNGDGCSADCRSDESCGNGIVDAAAGEVCDDGNTDDADLCSADCHTSMLCGNGALDSGEECDDGDTDDGDGCSASCLMERCGNGRTDSGEACDDGNTDETDGCRSDCTFTCSADADCGDGDVCNGDETCADPGTTASACAAATAPASDGTACGSGLICIAGGCASSGCGDGVVDPARSEDCDDGNTTDDDGCDSDCTFTCSADADCADANPCNGAETCSMAGTASSACAAGAPLGDGASCGGGLVCNGGSCAAAGCGDGIVTGTEQCDDGNTADADGCDADCTWTCASNADCADGRVCNGAETCTSPGTLASRCAAGSAPADGTSCGGGQICNGGTCVAPRCGDGIVSSSEQCDDRNTTSGDGCENDCTWTCASAADCDDGNACDGAESCTSPSSMASRCAAGTAPAMGTACDRDMSPATRDICRASACVASRCGDGYVDLGASPPEQCDDGGTIAGDGCDPSCQTEAATPPTAFRVSTLRLISPHIVASILGSCQDITDNAPTLFGSPVADSVNTQLQTAVDPMSAGGSYSLHMVSVFRPLDPAAAASASELHLNAACDEMPAPDSCGPDATMPDVVLTSLSNQSSGICYMAAAADVNVRAGDSVYAAVNTVSGPCFVSDEIDLTISLSGITIPLEHARVAATYSGSPPNQLVTGVVTGFLSDTAAADAHLPDSILLIGGDPLYQHLQAGNRSTTDSSGASIADGCNVRGGASEDDGDLAPDGTTRGFWFFLDFTSELVDWTGT